MAQSIFELISGCRGHFRLESGLHSEVWFDLDDLFAEPQRIAPFVAHLARLLLPHDVKAVCGPLLGGAFLAQLVAQALDLQFCFTERSMPEHREGLYQTQYKLPAAFGTRVYDERVAIVDDIMSAGSALRGTYSELNAHGATTAVAGALLVLGDAGADFFREQGVAVEAVARDRYSLWLSSECPLCVAGIPLEDVATETQ